MDIINNYKNVNENNQKSPLKIISQDSKLVQISRGEEEAFLLKEISRLHNLGYPADAIQALVSVLNSRYFEQSKSDAELDNLMNHVCNNNSQYKHNIFNDEHSNWTLIRALPPLQPDVVEMPIELVPKPLQGWISDVCERWQIPIEMIAVPTLAVISSLIGCRLGIAPREFDDWVIVPTLWCMLVAPSGSMKSDVLKEALKFLQDIENTNNQKYFDELKMYERSKKSPSKDGSDKVPPIHKRQIVCDTTSEKLGMILSENPNGVLQYQDELSGLLASFTKKGREEDRSFYIKAYDGTHYHPMDRVKRGSTILARLCVSVLGAIQPDIFKKVFSEIIKDGLSSDGFVPRFQMMVYPNLKTKWENVKRGVDIAAQDRVATIFKNLSELVCNIHDPKQQLESLPYKDIPITRFTADAQKSFDEWLETNINYQRSGAEANNLIRAYLDKNRKLVPALALNFQILEYCDSSNTNSKSLRISSNALEMALKWRQYLETHARKIFGDSVNCGLMLAHSIANKIQNGKIYDGMTIRDFKRKGWGKSKDEDIRVIAFDILQEHNWLRIQKINTNGKGSDSEVIRLNPNLFLKTNPQNILI